MAPVTRETFASWIGLYEQLWRTEGTEEIGRLFAPDAVYLHSPYEPPVTGLADIATDWERGRDGANEDFTMSADIVAVEGNTGVARVLVRYGKPANKEYLDLWVVRFNDTGHCVSFEEWPFWPNQPWTAGEPRK